MTEVLTVSSAPRTTLELTDFHEALPPKTSRWHSPGGAGKGTKWASTDYWKIFSDDQSWDEGHGHAYEVRRAGVPQNTLYPHSFSHLVPSAPKQKYGIDPIRGALAAIRRDGYVSLLTVLEDTASLDTAVCRRSQAGQSAQSAL